MAVAESTQRVFPVLFLLSGQSIELRRYWTSKERFERSLQGSLPRAVVEFIGKMHKRPA